MDVFWGMIMSLVTPFMTDCLGASAELTSLIWMTAPFAGLITGTYVGSFVDSLVPGEAYSRLCVMRISLVFIVLLCVAFALIPIYLPPHSERGIYACPVATIIFFLLMVLINFYMTPYFCMKGHFGDAPVSKFVPPIWSALGYIAAVMIIRYPPEFVPTDYQTLYFFVCAVVLMGIFTAILTIAVKKLDPNPRRMISKGPRRMMSKRPRRMMSKRTRMMSKRTRRRLMPTRPFVVILVVVLARLSRDVCCKPSGSFLRLFRRRWSCHCSDRFFSWASLYSILPVANDWYARVICDKHPGESGYLDAVAEASNLRLYQQLAQLVASIFFATIALCVESPEKDETDSANIDSTFKYQYYEYKFFGLGFQVITQSVCLLCLSLGLYYISIAQANRIGIAYAGFALTGFGPVAIYPGREFQRAFFRQVRSLKNKKNPEANYPAYAARDSTYDGVVYNNFVVAGQILTFWLYYAFFGSVGYPDLIRVIGVGGGCLSILLVLLTLFSWWRCHCVKSCLDEGDSCNGYCCSKQCLSISNTDSSKLPATSTKPNFFTSAPMVKVAPRIRFRTLYKKHQF